MKWRDKRRIKKKVKKMDVHDLAERRFYLRQKSSEVRWRIEQLKNIGEITEDEKFERGLIEKRSEKVSGFLDASMLVGFKYGITKINPTTGRLGFPTREN